MLSLLDPKPKVPQRLKKRVGLKLEARDKQRAEFDRWLLTHEDEVPSEEQQEEIAKLSAFEVVEAIKSKERSVTEIMITMCSRAAKSGCKYNSNTEEMFLTGITAAKAADEKIQKEGTKALPPLFGLPISIKDPINMTGLDSTNGMMTRVNDPAASDAAIVTALVAAGAIPYVKSNIPQLLMVPESMNRIFGTCKNPWNEDRTPGGSSGGEAALVASLSSFVGIGTDIGGSIRIPSSYCALSGFKPTPERVSKSGMRANSLGDSSGQRIITAVAGPMARNVRDLELIMRALWSPESEMYQADPTLPPVFFSDPPVQSKRRVGFYLEDGWFECAPSMQRAVEEAKAALESKGYEVVPFAIPRPYEFVRLYFSLLAADGAMRDMRSGLDGEPVLPEYRSIAQISLFPQAARTVTAAALEATGDKRKAHIIKAGGKRSVHEYWGIVAELHAYRDEFIKAFRDLNLDGLLFPAGSLPALPHGASKDLLVAQSYTYLYNLLHWPAGTVPVTTVKETECEFKAAATDEWGSKARAALVGATGLPVGVQVATLPWKDELCLSIMKDLEAALDYNPDFPTDLLC
mmetsp:Transcript_1213/g.1920  ORF Transcript_1213/g.1920 Transcript_1213/m.1920 type:complete len:576 (+) Transcript_1213:254-1981(+)